MCSAAILRQTALMHRRMCSTFPQAPSGPCRNLTVMSNGLFDGVSGDQFEAVVGVHQRLIGEREIDSGDALPAPSPWRALSRTNAIRGSSLAPAWPANSAVSWTDDGTSLLDLFRDVLVGKPRPVDVAPGNSPGTPQTYDPRAALPCCSWWKGQPAAFAAQPPPLAASAQRRPGAELAC